MAQNTPLPPLAETRSAIAIDSPCDDSITPIFPVRHALTEAALFRMARDGYTPGTPIEIDASPDHELRRIRQGYIYIYAKNGHPDDMGSDDKGTWLVFRYVSQPDVDDSSYHIRSDVHAPSGRYQFYKLEWTEGSSDGQWEVKDNRKYPYAFVNKQVSEIEITYSEERWPGHLFLMAELDASVREKLMTKTNILAPSTPHSRRLSEITSHVAEYKADAVENPEGNAIRYTAFQPESESQVVICPNSRENGRLVAVQDHLGELLDIQAAHLAKSHSLKTFSAEYLYPLMIGKGVKNLWDHIDHPGGFWDFADLNGSPLHDEYLGTYNSIETRQQILNAEIETLVQSYWTVSTREGPGSVLTEIEAVMDGFENAGSEADVRRLDYVFFLLSKAFQTLGTSAYGSASLAAMLGNTASDNSKQWFGIFNAAFEAMATAAPEMLAKYRTHMNITLAVTSKELAMAWTQSPSGLIHKAAVQRILGVHEITIPVSPNNIDDALRNTFARVGLIGQRPSAVLVNSENLTASIEPGTLRPQQVVGVPYFENITVTGTLTAQGQTMSNAYRAGDLGSNGGALALSFYAAFQTLKNWDSVRRSFTTAGAIARDPRVQISSALFDAAAGMTALREVGGSAKFTQGVSSRIFSRMFASGSDGFFSNASVTAQARNGVQATSRGMLRYVTVGHFAGAIGVTLAGFDAFEGFKADDMAAGFGNSLVAAGGFVILSTGVTGVGLVPGAIVGGLMIIAGTVATLFTDSDVDYWIRHGFWGRSGEYWNADREVVEVRLNDAKKLANGLDPYKSAFEQELKDYKDLTGTLKIGNETEGDMRFEITCPALENVADLGKLDATVRVITPSLGMGGGGLSGPQVDVTKHFIGAGIVHLVLNEAPVADHDRISDLRVDASYPKLTGGVFSDRLSIKAWKL